MLASRSRISYQRIYANKQSPNTSLQHLPKTPKQTEYVSYLENNNIPLVIAIGPAGCGKTLISCAHAMNKLIHKDIRKIVITRPAVTMDESHGYLPGDLESKMMPWLIPIYDCFKEYVTPYRLKEFISNGDIEICPLSYIRGRTFHDAWVIADESQNMTMNQTKTLLTRMGQNSKMILTGDLDQCDLKTLNGLEDFLVRYEQYHKQDNNNLIRLVKFDNNDIMRSEIVKEVLKIYEC